MYLLLLTFALSTIVSCGGQNEGKKALREMEKIVEKAEKDKEKLTPEEWKALALEFEQYEKTVNEAIENNKIGAVGQMKCLTLTTRWATVYGPEMLQEMIPDLSEPLKNKGDELEQLIRALDEDSIMKKALE